MQVNRLTGMVILLFCIMSVPLYAKNEKSTELNRQHLWGRLGITAAMDPSYGLFFLWGSKYNFEQEVKVTLNGDESTSNIKDRFWLNEFWIGPYFQIKHSSSLQSTFRLLYRPQWYWPAEENDKEKYFRNTFEAVGILKKKLGALGINGRIILWNLLPVDDPNVKDPVDGQPYGEQPYSLINRFFLEFTYSLVPKKFAFTLGPEIFLNLLPNEDLGEKLWNRWVFWAGFNWNIVSYLNARFRYAYMDINKMNFENDQKIVTKRVRDHYFRLTLMSRLKLY